MNWGRLIGLMCLVMLTLGACTDSAREADAARGRQLYSGPQPLSGALRGHGITLPPSASRCINCHAVASGGPEAAASSPRSFGPLLTPKGLLQAVARRGGPPTRYDVQSFCRVLRTGVDPAYVLLARGMPRYEISDADCRALWVHLTWVPS